jgi:hypothetical protein
MTERKRPKCCWLFAVSLVLSASSAHADDLLDLANAELHLATVCPGNATVGIYGSLAYMLITEMFQTDERQNGDISLVERAQLDALLAEYALAPYLDPATASTGEGLLIAKFIVLAEADLSGGLPVDVSVSVARTDTQEIVCEHSSEITEADGLAGLAATLNKVAQAIASIAASGNHVCPRVGSLSYTADMSGNDWGWNVSDYFDVLIRDEEAMIRHVPASSQVSGLLVSATATQFPALPEMSAVPQGPSDPTGYLIQFPNLGAVGSTHLLVFNETPNPVMTTGQQNELEFPNVAAVALAQWIHDRFQVSNRRACALGDICPDTWYYKSRARDASALRM